MDICLGLEKAMAPHSSTLAWKIPWTEESGRLQSVRSQRVRHYWVTSLSLFTFMHWKEMATHSSVLAWRILETGEPGGPPSMGSHRVRHDWRDLAAAAAASLALSKVKNTNSTGFSTNKKCWRECVKKRTILHSWWKCKLVVPTVENNMEVL